MNLSEIENKILLTDSRSLTFADQTVFFALVTDKGDGHRYIQQLYNQGVRDFVISQPAEIFQKGCPEARFIAVPNTLEALQQVAAQHRAQFHIPVVGITGSNGKTIVKEWLYQLLHDTRSVVRSPRSFNSQIGVPLSVWQINSNTQLALIEAGISMTGEMQKLENIIRPNIGILTNIGTAHDAGFESREQKMMEKLILFSGCDTIIYNADIPGINKALETAGIKACRMSWSRQDKEAQILVTDILRNDDSTSISYIFLGKKNNFTIRMSDDASVENAMNCLALMLHLGFTAEDISQRMQRLTPIAMRLEVLEGKNGCLIINDSYNSDITSLETALEFQKRRSSKALSNTLIISDMLEAGLDKEACEKKIAELCKVYGVQKVIHINNTDEFLASGEIERFHNELILLKGARNFHFEKISEALELRRHETVLEVNLDAIVHNLNMYRAHMKCETKIVCMVKAFGYGAGSYELAKTLQDQNVDYLAVAVADEGAELRRQGIRVPIIVMNPEFAAFRAIIENNLEPEIYSFRLLRAFIEETQRLGVMNYPVHVKIDSGMHRLGFQRADIEQLISMLKAQDAVSVRSVFSHFATADCPDQEAFVHEQKRRFDECADLIRAAFPHKILRHICNSAGIEKFPQYQMEMCRLGIGLYGFEASEIKMDLETVATLKSTILQIKEIPATETVGYSRKGVLSRDSRIAMVPIGYADGYDRHLGNGNAEMWVCGKRCKTVGNVCMDVTFLDLTDCPEAQEGDSVEIFGRNIPVPELSSTLNTIPYEVISTVSTRVKRIYYKE